LTCSYERQFGVRGIGTSQSMAHDSSMPGALVVVIKWIIEVDLLTDKIVHRLSDE